MSTVACTGVSLYAALASLWDIRERRIPNWLSGIALLAALPAAVGGGGIGINAALSGLLLGGAVLLVPFITGAVGGGDVKFAAVAGAWLGPEAGLNALLLGTALGLFVGLGYAAAMGRARAAIRGAARLVWLLASSLSFAHVPPPDEEAARTAPIPYAVPLAVGVVGAAVLARGECLLF
jgi:prepilin peptidase CpaA